jgi:hypothetical protein
VGASLVHPAALYACDAIERLAQTLLPHFIDERYRIVIVPAHPTTIALGKAVDIGLRDVTPSDGGGPELTFPLEDAASGFNLWLQLALREATARLWMLVRILEAAGARAKRVSEVSESLYDDTPLELADMPDVWTVVERALKSLEDPASVSAEGVTHGLPFSPAGHFGPRWPPTFRSRLYLIDEPEQRLHPALQRAAACWLADLMDGWASQCVMATHSVAFIDMPGDAAVYELVREGNSPAALQRLDPAQFDAHSQLARAMGWDRGELLAHWRAFLFVEGMADVGVFEELFRQRLKESRICVVPVHGHRGHEGLVEIEVFASRMTTPIVALFDGISDGDIQRLHTDPSYRSAMQWEKGEIGTAARIVDIAVRRERQIEIFTVGAPDIFDLLDVDAIRATVGRGKGRPSFPGHAAARAQFGQGGGNAAAYKAFLQREYGVLTSERAMRAAAHRMSTEGVVPERLDELLARVELLALTAEPR